MKDDPELTAMASLCHALDPLDEPTRERVLRWARERYGTTKVAMSVEGPPGTALRSRALPRDQVTGPFSDVADLYGAANPSTDGEKVLVVGYWFHTSRGENELDSQAINNELKNLGYPISNVTRAVTSLATAVPRLVVQTKKTGSTKQARKKFKLTVEGMKRVEQMLGGASLPLTRTERDRGSSDDYEG